jgi:hypothetical protein
LSVTLNAGLTPAKWRVLNALFCANAWTRVPTLMQSQDVGMDDLTGLEQAELVLAAIGDEGFPAKLAATGASIRARVRLTKPGRSLVVNNDANQVICMLGARPDWTALVRDLKAEGMSGDDLLFRMAAAGLVEPRLESGPDYPLEAFKRLPSPLPIRLTTKGRRYYPRGT